MKNTKQYLTRYVNKLIGIFPSKLPTGMAEFEVWAESIYSTYSMPTQDRDSLKFTLATILMHLDSTSAYKSKFYFALVINASAAKQVAGAVFYEVKTKQQEEARKSASAASGTMNPIQQTVASSATVQ